mmetsp:Transcript_14604/g.29780  ORF Transcript_14604/g.29780 Transcript_14604/m.29780 type:complete len:140 (+) Transcript_14604:222-641(+)
MRALIARCRRECSLMTKELMTFGERRGIFGGKLLGWDGTTTISNWDRPIRYVEFDTWFKESPVELKGSKAGVVDWCRKRLRRRWRLLIGQGPTPGDIPPRSRGRENGPNDVWTPNATRFDWNLLTAWVGVRGSQGNEAW